MGAIEALHHGCRKWSRWPSLGPLVSTCSSQLAFILVLLLSLPSSDAQSNSSSDSTINPIPGPPIAAASPPRYLPSLSSVVVQSGCVQTDSNTQVECNERARAREEAPQPALAVHSLHGAFLVFFMQVGFISLELGGGRAKNVRNILLKNMVDIMLCALCWWSVGYPLANGTSVHGFIGGPSSSNGGLGGFFGESSSDWGAKPWFYTFTFCLATVSIVSSCLAERTDLLAYPILTVVMSMWVHPVIAFWAWSQKSWLNTLTECTFVDFAGGTVVHLTGGCMGLVGAILCGPRLGRFEDGRPKPMPGHDIASVAVGTIFLWFGWYGFNCGSLYTQPNSINIVYLDDMVDRVALNMTLSAAGGGLTALAISSARSGSFDLHICCNGIMSGLVSATATCGFVPPWAALVVGIIAGSAYLGTSRMMLYLGIDDPLDSTAIHVCGGMLGTLLNSAFAKPEYLEAFLTSPCGGFVYSSTGGLQLGMQVLGIVVCAAWAVFFSVIMFVVLKHIGRLRVDQATELAGIDNMEHGGPAYPEFSLAVMHNNPSS